MRSLKLALGLRRRNEIQVELGCGRQQGTRVLHGTTRSWFRVQSMQSQHANMHRVLRPPACSSSGLGHSGAHACKPASLGAQHVHHEYSRASSSMLAPVKPTIFAGASRRAIQRGRLARQGAPVTPLAAAAAPPVTSAPDTDMKVVEVDLGDRSYPIYIGQGLLQQGELLQKHIKGNRVLIVTNSTIAPLYLQQ